MRASTRSNTASCRVRASGIPGDATTGIHALAYTGDLLRYVGSGVGTAQAQAGLPGLRGAWGSSADDVYAVGGANVFRFDGTSWVSVYAASKPLNAIAGAGNQRYAVGDDGTIVHYNGANWFETTAGTAHLRGVWTQGSEAFVTGVNGTILRGSGVTFAPMTSPVTSELRAVFGLTVADVYAVGSDGAIVHFDGTAWTRQTSPVTAMLEAIWGAGPTSMFAAGAADRTPLRWHDVAGLRDRSARDHPCVVRTCR